MGAEAGTSLLPNVALLAVGFLLGRVQFVPIAAQLVEEICALSTVRKVSNMQVYELWWQSACMTVNV